MRAFKVYLNDKGPCTAGIGNDWNPRDQLRNEKRYVRQTAKKLGWKILTRNK
jgi:hypothetical protein